MNPNKLIFCVEYKIKAIWDKPEVEVYQAVTLIVEISGKGNIKTIRKPEYSSFKSFKEYETVSSLNLSKEGYHVSGSKVFKTVLVPQRQGITRVPEIKFSFFNPGSKKYCEVSAKPSPLKVKPGKKQEPVVSGISQEEVRILGADIRHLKSPDELLNFGNPLYSKTWFMLIQFFPVFIFLGSYARLRRKDKLNQNIGLIRRKRAFGQAKIGLKKAIKTKKEVSSARDFYICLSKTLNDYLANKLNLPFAGMTQNDVEEGLKRLGVREEIIKKVLEAIEEIDLARFTSSGSNSEAMRKSYENIESLIKELEILLK